VKTYRLSEKGSKLADSTLKEQKRSNDEDAGLERNLIILGSKIVIKWITRLQ
jgi:hypothetical protein